MLPRLDGISLVKRARAARRELPVLFLSAMVGAVVIGKKD